MAPGCQFANIFRLNATMSVKKELPSLRILIVEDNVDIAENKSAPRSLDRIERSVNKMENIIETLLWLSRSDGFGLGKTYYSRKF